MNDIPAEAAPPRRRRRIRRRWIAGAGLVALGVGLWSARAPIADSFIQDQLQNRDIPARYTIRKIGFRTQRLTDIVIGDPRRPDLVARAVEVRIGYGITGPYVAGIKGEGVRLYGRFADGRLSLGALDRLRDPTSTDPFALPDVHVELSDARARVETPWGNVGAVLEGRGNLRENFLGKLALIAPRLTATNCEATDASFYGSLVIRDVQPRLVGPLRSTRISCADGSVRAVNPQMALDVALSEDLQRWNGEADAALSGLVAGDARAERLAVLAKFAGTAERTEIKLDMNMARLSVPGAVAAAVTLDAKAQVGAGAPRVDGAFGFARAAATGDVRQSIAGGAAGLDGTPLGPIAARAGKAVAAMLANGTGGARFALTGEGDTARVELIAPRLASASGAFVTGTPDSRIGYLYALPTPAVIATGGWRFGGGDLPSGAIDLDRRADGSLNGTARLAPYVAGDARLALAPVRFAGAPGGAMRFDTIAALSGPIGDGRVEELTVPLKGRIAATGRVEIDGGCHPVRARSVAISSARFAGPTISLCSRPGAPLLRAGKGGIVGDIRIPALALRGAAGSSPLAIDSGPLSLDLATRRWTWAAPDVRLGEPDSQTYFAADTLTGAAGPQGMAGELRGGRARIGAVPLDMAQIDGAWRWAGAALTLGGRMRLTDAEPDARFYPLISDNAELQLVDGVIEARAGFREEKTGAAVFDTSIRHALEDGAGAADITVRELRFNDAFQPDQLTRLALGIVANVQGSVVGDGRIEWNAEGVSSRGTFATADTNLAAAFGPVKELTTTISFVDLIGLRTAPGQIATIAEVNPGIPVIDGVIEYQLLANNRVRIEGGRWPFAGGELVMHPATLDFNADQPRRLSFDIIGVDAAVFLQSFGFDNINATGIFDGTLPVEFDGLGGRIVDGRIDSRAGGGTLAYVGELSNRNLGAIANFAFGALRSLKYDDLTIILNGDLDGEMVTDIRFGGVGQGEGATRNFLTKQIARLPLVFNVKITAPFRQLLTSAKGFYDPSLLIEQNLPALMRAQEEAEAAAKAAENPVQATESEPVQ